MLSYVDNRMVGRQVNGCLPNENKDSHIVPPRLKNHNLNFIAKAQLLHSFFMNRICHIHDGYCPK